MSKWIGVSNLKNIGFLFIFLGHLNGFGQPLDYNKKYIDSILPLLGQMPDDPVKVDQLGKLSAMYIMVNPDSAIHLSQEGESIAVQIDYRKGEIHCLIHNAWAFATMGEWVKATVILNKAIPICEKYDPEQLPLVYNTMFFTYAFNDDFEQALPWVQKSLASPSFLHQPDFYKWGTYLQLGLAYAHLGKLDSAQVYADTLSSYLARYGRFNESISHDSYMLQGNIAFERKDYSAALGLYSQAPWEIGLARVYQKLGKSDSAIFYAGKSLQRARFYKSPVEVKHAAEILAQEYAEIDAAESNKYLNIYINVSDSLNSTEKRRQIEKIRLDEQQKEFELAKKEAATRNRIIQIIFTGAILSLALFSYLMWRNYKNKLAANKKLEESYAALKATQAQLVQSEKMASLGELTAGIAHEIQNPLNFVNNFSEVNTELIGEMKKEITAGNYPEVSQIADDLAGNMEKITEHGKRADAIVKSMLQHSRTSTGQKEMTDINQLVDEYARLAFHGMRAKDKSFNTNLKTDYAPDAGQANLVPQDIGRVLLNLLNNAFYAVNEKKRKSGEGFAPEVSIETRKVRNSIQISVTDNGDGIPEKIREKIFQPFFTTKPTGEGTGLGLSLSYDIITKGHGGEMKYEPAPGGGTKMTIMFTAL